MLDWLFIQTFPDLTNNGVWYARWRWDNQWMRGQTKAHAVLRLKQNSHC